jgi:hypothetical protein
MEREEVFDSGGVKLRKGRAGRELDVEASYIGGGRPLTEKFGT